MYNIIGAGLAGSIVAKELDKKKLFYRIFDCNEKFAASKISENLFCVTWLKGVPYIKSSIDYLQNNYNVEKRSLVTNASTQIVFHIPVDKILVSNYINKKVTKLTDNGCYCGSEFYGGVNIICAGYFTKELLPIKNLESLTGHGLIFEANQNNLLVKETMRHYRPYTHEKVIKISGGRIWYGDSTTILHDNYIKNQDKYIRQTLIRAKKIGLSGKYIIKFGARPFINDETKKFGYYKQVNKNNYVITGGWKDGLVIYPYLVSKLMKDLL